MVLALLVAGACAPSGRSEGSDSTDVDDDTDQTDNDNPDGFFIDAAPFPDAPYEDTIDAGNVYPDASSTGPGACEVNCPPPPASGCNIGGSDICGNGSDDNCNGKVDEGCACSPGAVQSCFANVPGKRNVGACQDGQQTCQGSGEFTQWGPCTGGITPTAEACDSLDNDCNGCVDDAENCCNVDLECPAKMPEGAPFKDYLINGTDFFQGPVSSWTWTVTGGPCDQLLAPNVSFKLNGTKATSVTGANLSSLVFHPTLSGDYTVNVKMLLPDGTTIECTFIVHITGPGLRVELCWDKQGSQFDGGSDIDLHMHKPGTTTPWFTTNGQPPPEFGTGPVNHDDCYYRNCKATSYLGGSTANANWGYAKSDLSECIGSPLGATWMGLGYCANPRLDDDNISEVGVAENINVDKPENNKSYRVAVHYYGGEVETFPMVNVYCGGKLLATYGKAPDKVPGFTGGGRDGVGTIWRVVDVVTHVNTAGETDSCDLKLLNPPGMTSGYRVTCPNENGSDDIDNCIDNSF